MNQKVITTEAMNTFLDAVGLPRGTKLVVIKYDESASQSKAGLLEVVDRHLGCLIVSA